MSACVAVVEGAIEYEGRFLIIQRPLEKHAGGLFSFPEGKVELSDYQSGGNVLHTALRCEIEEEVRLV